MRYYCNICKKTISKKVYDWSKKHHSRPLCRQHQRPNETVTGTKTVTKIETKTGQRYPSHTEFYRDLHLIEDDMVRYIFKVMGWEFEKQGFVFYKTTKYDIEFEVRNWDIVITIENAPDDNLRKYKKKLGWYPTLCIEYKSSVNEWGKQVDAFFRQIKKRKTMGPSFLLSFDPEFKVFGHACDRAKIDLVVLPEEMLDKMRGE